MDKEEKIQKIIRYKNKIDTLMHEKYHKLAYKYGLSLGQYHLLIELDELMLDVDDELKGPTVGEIAKNINNSQNTMSEKITRLENRGLVKRIKDSEDRRISRIVLTEEGRNLIDSIDKEANSKFLFNSISKMEDKDINNLLSCLENLIEQMNGIE
ncbi:MarR family transcriptional regulator [Acidilutibacter cellobiosedens]|jgi:DNA-binding MarR family transcriptional regulator|uniref:MarR family transcriptional regulator n=1 Tax=Acidilutibacter cellobiosedens TaxID=2507161 RepID=A0A410Q957_9FIRM|nr:MarR family transcriptional regulator [Acidilutibacter cellobiosedens]MBE6083374.1 MarR family transcriptional regulator [Tissierellaceae bacterium]QAT60496.1 MarR family transcriptional regulator [Acidilutibacter cellobiosedens]